MNIKGLVEPIRDKNDVQRITRYLYDLDFKYGLIWEIGIYIGIRVSDILNFTTEIEGKSKVMIIEQKTKKRKTFPISKHLQFQIKKYIHEYRRYGLNGNNKLFIGIKHHNLERSAVYRAINRACKDLKIEANVGTHTMRKTFGYHHYRQFRDVALLQTIFNHTSPSITLRYIGITQDDIDFSYSKLDYSCDEPEFSYGDRDAVYNTKYQPKKEEKVKVKTVTRVINKHSQEFKDLLKIKENITNYIKAGGKMSALCEMFLAT